MNQEKPHILIRLCQEYMPYGKYKGTMYCDLPISYLEWFPVKECPKVNWVCFSPPCTRLNSMDWTPYSNLFVAAAPTDNYSSPRSTIISSRNRAACIKSKFLAAFSISFCFCSIIFRTCSPERSDGSCCFSFTISLCV